MDVKYQQGCSTNYKCTYLQYSGAFRFIHRCAVPPQVEPRVLKRGLAINAGHDGAANFVVSL